MSQFAVKWIYVLEEDYTFDLRPVLGPGWAQGCAFEDRAGRRWLEIHPDGQARVFAPYAWDGCTPKFALWDIVIGVPDGVPSERTKRPKAYHASLVHDVLYQFLDAGLPLARADADRLFLALLARERFAPRWLYYAAVRCFGGASRRVTRWKRNYGGRRIALPPLLAPPPQVAA